MAVIKLLGASGPCQVVVSCGCKGGVALDLVDGSYECRYWADADSARQLAHDILAAVEQTEDRVVPPFRRE